MRQIFKVAGRIVGFAVLTFLLVLRIALAAVLAVVTPIVMPILALLSGGGLLVAIGFACAGHWHDAAKGFGACFVCSITFGLLAALAHSVDPYAFRVPVTVTNRPHG